MLKTITFAICHFTVAFSVAYLLTGNIGVSSLLALVEPWSTPWPTTSTKSMGPHPRPQDPSRRNRLSRTQRPVPPALMPTTPRPLSGAALSPRPRLISCQSISVLTEISETTIVSAMELTPVSQRFVLHWGEMGTRWGVNRTVAQIHALLFITGRPLNAEELADTLNVARSNISNSLKELQNWQLIRIVHVLGDRRDHFETSGDVWELFRIIVAERQRREIEPTLQVLKECIDSPDFQQESPLAQERIRNTWQFMDTLTTWTREMLRLSTATLSRVLKMGASIQKLLGRDK